MAEYSRKEFSQYPKAALLDHIEQQNEQLGRLETRFRDVVRAYKSLTKEKEALDAGLRVLSLQKQPLPTVPSPLRPDVATPPLERSEDGTRSGDEGSSAGGERDTPTKGAEPVTEAKQRDGIEEGGRGEGCGQAEGQEDTVLVRQVGTLTRALSTLSEERTKLETSYQKDKKALLSQQELLTKQLQTEKERGDNEIAKLQKQLEETQHHLSQEKRLREEDQTHHVAILKELQDLVVSEREGKTFYSTKLQEAESALSKLHAQASEDRSHETEQRVLSDQLEDVKGRLKAAEEQNSRAPAALLKVQRELERTQAEHLTALVAEQQRANEAETALRLHAEHEERRVANLETKVSELSEMVGKYEQRREQDQHSILKLKERVAQLDSENTVLTKAQVERQGFVNNDVTEQISALQEKVSKLKALLKVATQKISEKAILPSNVEDMSVNDYSRMLSMEAGHEQQQLELYQLKDEYERYKRRAQTVLKSRDSGKDVDLSKDLKDLQILNSQQHGQLEALRAQLAREEEDHSLQLQSLREEVRSLHDKHQKDALLADLQYKQKLQDLNQHILGTRERTLKVVAEKDAELTQLRALVQQFTEGRSLGVARTPSVGRQLSVGSQSSLNSGDEYYAHQQRPSRMDDSLNLTTTPTTDVTEGAVQKLLEQSPAPSDGRLFLYKHDQQRKEAEHDLTRRRWLELEETLKEAQEREQKFAEQNKLLKEEIRKLERNRSRETENFEYLKNVVFHYMCAEGASKEQMVTPISTILHFSPEEVQQIKDGSGAKKWTYKF